MLARKLFQEKHALIRTADKISVAMMEEQLLIVGGILDAFVDRWQGWQEPYGKRGVFKKQLQAELRQLGKDLRLLRPWLDMSAMDEQVRQGKRWLKQRGPLPVEVLCGIIQAVRAGTRVAADRRRNFELQSVTLTLRMVEADRRVSERYRAVVRRLKEAVRDLLQKGLLTVPGMGATASIHLQDTVHAHLLYWGPRIDPVALRDVWCRMSKSFITDVKPLKPEMNVEWWIHYLFQLPEDVDPAARVRYWDATRRLALITHYGVFHCRGLEKLRRQAKEMGHRPEEEHWYDRL